MPATVSPPALYVRGLTKAYGRLRALENVSFDVPAAHVVGVIGPNGAGKTTLFGCLGGLIPPDAGTILGEDRFFLPDAIQPWAHASVGWALEYAVAYFGGDATRRPDLVRALGLESMLSRPMGKLSKGQRKRASLAIGLLTPHPVLLIDEPFDGLDLRQTREAATLLRAQSTLGRTLVLSIHQIADAARVCDRFVLLSGGRVCGDGTIDELTGAVGTRTTADAALALEEVFLART